MIVHLLVELHFFIANCYLLSQLILIWFVILHIINLKISIFILLITYLNLLMIGSMFSLWAFLLRNKKAKFSCEKSSDEEEAAAERASEVNFADEISGINTGPPSPTSSINY
ncbi:uncharacterized protein DS421_14g469530 [Arachis hypogaea]|nr:uncharacterized protein DS421_14g469530 [Arachis hypogaea]